MTGRINVKFDNCSVGTTNAIWFDTVPPRPDVPAMPSYPLNYRLTNYRDKEDQIRSCPCNPANGGSGICGCIMSNPTITC